MTSPPQTPGARIRAALLGTVAIAAVARTPRSRQPQWAQQHRWRVGLDGHSARRLALRAARLPAQQALRAQ